MRTLLLTAIMALAIAPATSMAFETKDVDCEAFAESTERVAKDINKSKDKETKEDPKAKAE